MSKINPEFENFYFKYLELIRGANRTQIESLRASMVDHYFRTLTMLLDMIGDKPIRDTFANYTTHYNKRLINVKFYNAIASGVINNDLVEINGTQATFEMISVPMETMAIYKDRTEKTYVLKCFTLFSHCESGWSDITMDFITMMIKMSFDIESYPLFLPDVYPIAVHSPNVIPDLNTDFKFFKLGTLNQLHYSQWKIERLDKGYDTDCRNYDPKRLTRSECIFNCYQEAMKNIQHTNGFIKAALLIRQSYFQSMGNMTMANSSYTEEDKITLICKN